MHMVLSMPEGVEPESVKNAVRDFAKDVFGKNHEYVFALHTDERQPHVHLTVKIQGHDGNRLNPRKDGLRQWRDDFALAMRDQGGDADATPRASRSIVKKPESQVIRHKNAGTKPKSLKEIQGQGSESCK